MIGQRLQHGRQFAGGGVVACNSQQLRQVIARRGRTQRRQRFGDLEMRQRELRQGKRHRSRALKTVGQFPHRARLRSGRGVPPRLEHAYQTTAVEAAQPCRQR
ncbi:hypothetical protein Q5762_26520 [Streptomyces sp. P9(2023)]|nr:hypothetical protein [Streptomyces sp. P9(2023)]MDT9691825.1 hypothetical protein [Streptomyces sp. P9(2023)]